MRYLLDTNVVSQLLRASPSANVLRWLSQVGEVDLWISAITVRELVYGVEKARRERAAALDAYPDRIGALAASYEGRVLPIDARVARAWAVMPARSNRHVDDTGLAATAAVHGLTVVTRNLAHLRGPRRAAARPVPRPARDLPARAGVGDPSRASAAEFLVMRRLLIAVPVLLLLAAPAAAAPATRAAHMDAYLSIWARDDAITPATVARLYGRQVDYYGRPMSAEGVYRDKLAFVRRWPLRSYAAVPGTVSNDCTGESARCRVSAVMRWSRADRAGRGNRGTSTVRLDLAREDGALKIVRESGEPVPR